MCVASFLGSFREESLRDGDGDTGNSKGQETGIDAQVYFPHPKNLSSKKLVILLEV